MGCGGDLNLLQAGVGLFSIKASKPVVYAARTLEKVAGAFRKILLRYLAESGTGIIIEAIIALPDVIF